MHNDDARLNALKLGLIHLMPELRGRAMRLTRSSAQADDLVQDAVERALRFGDRFEEGTNIRAWAHQVLFSVFVSRYRKDKRERRLWQRVLADPTTKMRGARRAAEPDAGWWLSEKVEACVDSLPTGFRETFVLVDLQEHSYREAAERLGIPVGTVMSRLHRARKLLATTVGPLAA
jgi:RNA polymerase sigma-70 factor (ECF subfamily)